MSSLVVLQERLHTRQLALGEARTRANMEQAVRLWAALHGGVYLPSGESPSPHNPPDDEVVTPSGMRLTLMSPNAILRQLASQDENNYQAISRIVSLSPKEAEYTPDEWERKALQTIASENAGEFYEFAPLDGKPALRMLQPIRVQPACLKCHLDLDGQVGEMIGGLSIGLPLDHFIAHERLSLLTQGIYLLGQWLFGGILLLLGMRYLWRESQERLQVQQSLNESEGRYRSLIENLPFGIYRVTPGPQGKILMANPAALRLFGCASEDEIKKVCVADLYADPQQRSAFSEALLNQGYAQAIELELKRKDGSRFWGLVTAWVVHNQESGEIYFDGTLEDITEHKAAQQAQALAEAQARRLAEKLKAIAIVAAQITALKDSPNLAEKVIQILQENTRYYCTSLFLVCQGKLIFEAGQGDYLPGHEPQRGMEIEYGRGVVGNVARLGQPLLINDVSQDSTYVPYEGLPFTRSELALPIKNGKTLIGVLDVQSAEPNAFDETDLEALSALAEQLAVALENAQLFTETRRRARELEILSQVSTALRTCNTRAEINAMIREQVSPLLEAQAVALILTEKKDNAWVESASGLWAEMSGWKHLPQWSPWASVIASGEAYLNNHLGEGVSPFAAERIEGLKAAACVALIAQDQILGALAIGRSTTITEDDLRLMNSIGDMLAATLQRARLYEQIQHHAEQMSAVNIIGRTLTESLELSQICTRLVQAIQDLYPDALAVFINRYDPRHQHLTWLYGQQGGQRMDISRLAPLPIEQIQAEPYAQALLTRQPQIVEDAPQPRWKSQTGSLGPHTCSALYVPMFAKGEPLGLIQIHSDLPSRFSPQDAELLSLVANTAAIAIENARLFGELKQQVQRLGALRAMDVAIRSSLDLKVTLNVLLDQVTSQLQVDAACVLLYNPHLRTLEFAIGRGFRSTVESATLLRVDQSLAGRAVLERQPIHIPNLRANMGTRPLLQSAIEDAFVAYYAVPLIAKGQVKGVMEIYQRTPLDPDSGWMEFLEALSGDAAIAIDNAALFDELQRSNVEITLAYDRTLEGWSRALELRDRETEGHSQRVTEMTLELARALGMSEVELVHVRRGALLHDIGKMGVPDEILHKPGPLTDEEWEIMRRHPVYALELLSPIPYLKPALDIPAYHHERWDGNGYPNRLKGEQIPLAARIFAVVDVYDALLSERPYRPAWPEEKVINYLQEQAGHHFDPHVVEVFLRLRGKGN